MKCLQCTDTALPQKALCANCYSQWVAENERQSRHWEEREVGPGRSPTTVETVPATCRARIIAWFFDLALLALISAGLLVPVAALVGVGEAGIALLRSFNGDPYNLHHVDHTLYTLIKVTLLCYLVPAWCYFALFEFSLAGGTPGKFLMGLRVRPHSGTLTLTATSIRFVFRSFPFLLPVICLPQFFTILPMTAPALLRKGAVAGFLLLVILTVLDPILALVTRGRLALHDFAAGTEVIEVRKCGYKRTLTGLIAVSLMVLTFVAAGIGQPVLDYSPVAEMIRQGLAAVGS